MRRNILLLVTLVILLMLNSCHSNPLESPVAQGSRDYVWTVDTLNMPMNVIGAIWGSSPTDVWAVGAGGDDNDRLQHYDGIKWTPYTKEPIYCYGNTLFGFSQDNVWMGGDNGAIWRFDGNKWSENFIYKVEGARNVDVMNVWGTNINDLYASGTIDFYHNGIDVWQGFVLHYNGWNWTEVIKANFNSQFLGVRKEDNNVFVWAVKTSQTASDTVAFYKLEDYKLKEIYSSSYDKITFGNIHVIDSRVYFLIGQDVYRYFLGKLVKQFSFSNPNFWYYIFGRNENDIFVSMRDGLAHFNGEDIQYLIRYPDLSYKIIGGDPAVFEKEVFCGFYSNGRNMILHGKLKD